MTSNIGKPIKHKLSSEWSTHDTTFATVELSHCSNSHQFNQGFVKFDLGNVHVPGVETFHVKSEFPRLKPKFEREFVENHDLELLSANLLAWVNIHFLTTGQEAYFKQMTLTATLFSVYVNPLPELHSNDMNLFIKFIFCLWYTDDAMESAIENKIPFKVLKQGTDQLEMILIGKRKNFEDVPNYPWFCQVFNSLMDLHNICKNTLPEYEKRVEIFNKYLQRYFEAHRWYSIDEIDERYSEETFRTWRKIVAFFDGIPALVALIHGVTLRDEILQSCAFQRILDIANSFGGFVNDLLGMKKEFVNKEKDNLIVFLVIKKKMSLDKAVLHVCKLMETELLDYILLKDVMLKEFEQDENLVKYLDILDSLIDGHHLVYPYSSRHRSVGSVLLTR